MAHTPTSAKFLKRNPPAAPATEREYVTYVRGQQFTIEITTIPSTVTPEISGTLETEPLSRGTALTSLEHIIRLTMSGADGDTTSLNDSYGGSLASSEGRDLDAISFANLPVIVLEQSPAKALSLNDIIDEFGDVPGAMLAIAFTGASPWLILTIPLGIVGFRVSREVGTALGEVAGDWIRELKPKKNIDEN